MLLEGKEVEEETQNKMMPAIKVSHVVEGRNLMESRAYTKNYR